MMAEREPMSISGGTPKARGRWLRFSTRTLLLFVAIASLLAWASKDVWAAMQRRATRTWLESSGGEIVSLDAWNREHFLQQPDSGNVSAIQRWLGDEPIVAVTLPSMATADEVERIRKTFPEAQFIHVEEPRTGGFF
jgi:hypothetical protein